MKTRWNAALTMLLCIASAGAFAQGSSAEKKFYIGFDVGQSKLDRNAGFDSATSVDDRSTAYTLRFGYRFNQYFALEGGYTDLGDFSATVRSLCIANSACLTEVGTKTSIDGFLVNAVGTWPIARHFELNASAGAIYREMKVSLSEPVLGRSSISDTGTVMKFGIGIGVPINDRLAIGLDLTQYRDVGVGFTSSNAGSDVSATNEGESTVASLGVRWKF